MADDFTSDETVSAAKLNQSLAAGRIVNRGQRLTSSSLTSGTTILAVMEVPDTPVKAGRHYHIVSSPIYLDTSVDNDVFRAFLVYTTDGSTPTIASSQLLGSAMNKRLTTAASAEHVILDTFYVPSVDETLSLLLCISRSGGTGVGSILCDALQTISIRIYDCGVDTGDMGIDY